MTAARDCIDVRVHLMEARLSKGYSLADVVIRAGSHFTSQALGQWEAKKTLPTLPNLCLWARALGMKVTVEAVE